MKALGTAENPSPVKERQVMVVGTRRPLKPRSFDPVRAQHRRQVSRPPASSPLNSLSAEPKTDTTLHENKAPISHVPEAHPDFEGEIPTIPSPGVRIECPCFVRMRIDAHLYVVRMAYEFEPTEAHEGGDLWFNAQWPFSEGTLESGTRIAPFIGVTQFFATVVECEDRLDTLPPLPSPTHLPRVGQRYLTPVNARGKQYLLQVLGIAEAAAPITRAIGTHARVGDEVVVDELGTKFSMRLLSVYLLPDDPDDHDGKWEELDESFDDCDRAILQTGGPSWVTDDLLRYSQMPTPLRTPSPHPERLSSRHGILSSVSAVEAIGPAVFYMANTVEEERRHSWDSSWMADGEQLRSGQRWGLPEDALAVSRPWNEGQIEIEDEGSAHATERARGLQKEKELSAIEDPPIYNIPAPNQSNSPTSSQYIRYSNNVHVLRDLAKPDVGPFANVKTDPYPYPSPHPPSPAVVHTSASNKDKPLPPWPTHAQVEHRDRLAKYTPPSSHSSLLNVHATGVQSYPTPSSSHLRVSPARRSHMRHLAPRSDGAEATGLNPGQSDVMGRGESKGERLSSQGLGISFSDACGNMDRYGLD